MDSLSLSSSEKLVFMPIDDDFFNPFGDFIENMHQNSDSGPLNYMVPA